MNARELLQLHRSRILDILGRYGAEGARGFGSTARGEDNAASDIDLLINYRPGVTLLTEAAMIRELESLPGRRVDVVSERGMRPRVRERMLQEAVPL